MPAAATSPTAPQSSITATATLHPAVPVVIHRATGTRRHHPSPDDRHEKDASVPRIASTCFAD